MRRWSENPNAKYILTATVALRNLNHYCELTETTQDLKELKLSYEMKFDKIQVTAIVKSKINIARHQ